ncbi:double-strand break repair helicase AddA [Paracoccus sp. (in: a-proteobacteria)]|uniref:double-strand break repair helicase AddA n=1 Tax=Paracoccus sp. TaxID=267 RepID=UPI0026DFCBC9|nr:double-strand break repair helicase AddA [Paracoccus sp. (in: a-proteobacteria)]MDO5368856.1 double-strand break repair helicase AddA [Paracoccus sp. (in: a-proteobacteria)]
MNDLSVKGMGPDPATRAQHIAADPDRSTWLTANAGSGKTSVLTDRVARLLLAGTKPERILCLTYTKAAATEMQNRLLRRLGEWAMLDDAALTGRLARMGVGAGADLNAARRLFAQAIETPGGLKVQTIHSFCAGVLRRFPLEAGVPHGFAELDERSAANLRVEIIERMARDNAPEMADLLALQSDSGLDDFLANLRDFDRPPCPETLWKACGLPHGFDEPALLAQCFDGDQATLIPALIPLLQAGGTRDGEAAAKLSVRVWDRAGVEELITLEAVLLNGEKAKAPFSAKLGSFPSKDLQKGSCAPLMPRLNALMSRVEATRPMRLQLAQAQRTLALQRFGHAFGNRYAAAKMAGGWLDFDDLIGRTARLLDDSTMAQWVLFRLDGGIDHILVDEAQDTSPLQWRVIQRLTDEFTAGAGAADRARTLFVVGDPKQSIYSFQGADIAVFEARHAEFSAAFDAAGQPMQDAALRHSFRSSPAILRLTDAVFSGEAAQGLGDTPSHIAFHEGMPGRVDLWPPVPDPEKPEAMPWHAPVDTVAANAAPRVLAEAVAKAAAGMIGTPITLRNGQVRPMQAGDILILVQRRSAIFHDLIRALKQAGLPVAGADRLRLGGELAVKDIRAVLSVLATPEDDLSLAAALRSPIFGLSEEELYRLAAPRKGLLIQALRRSGHERVKDILSDLQGQADFLRPYDLISRLLVRHGGRARLIGRLGPEAEDGIDELLAQALTYETSETPSLTGFLVWLADDEAQVKRQPGAAAEGGGLIRVMTVHGAKGLESPVVILPDCAKRKGPGRSPPTILPDDGPPAHWRAAKAWQTPQVQEWTLRDQRRQEEERRRLLYVGLTRAESWLIVAAAGETGAGCESWHAMVADGFSRAEGLAQADLPCDWGDCGIRRLSFGDWPASAEAETRAARPEVTLPDCLHEKAPPVAHAPGPIAATALGGDKVLASDPANGGGREAALLAGTRLHLLLEHLPGVPPDERPARARDLLAGAEGGLPTEPELAALLEELSALVEAEELAPLFSPQGTVLREVALTAPLPNGRRLSGTIDRLIVTEGCVTALDYKSNAAVPEMVDAVPEGYLRQMAAYRHALRAIYPGRKVECAILWTRARSAMTLPDPLLDAAWEAAMRGLDPAGARP